MRARLLPLYLIPLIGIASLPFSGGDLAAWTALGLKMIETGHWPAQDPFSVLVTTDFYPAAWGASLIYALLFKLLSALFGDSGTAFTVLSALHWGFAVWVLHWLYHRSQKILFPTDGREPRGFVRIALYACWVSFLPVFGVRPAVLGLVPLILCFDLVRSARRSLKWKSFFKLALVQIIWANLHGSFVLGPTLLVWRFIITHLRTRRLPNLKSTLQPILLTLSSAIHPFGFKIFPYVVINSELAIKRRISEWAQTTPLAIFPAGAFYYLIVIVLIAIFFSSRTSKRQRWGILGTGLLPLILLGFSAIRNTGLVSLFTLPVLATHLRKSFGPTSIAKAKDSPSLRIPLLLNAILIVIWVLLWPPFRPWISPLLPETRKPVFLNVEYPISLLERIRSSHLPCPVFAEFELGGALMLNVPNKIFFDTRNIIYSDGVFDRYFSALQGGPGWNAWLESYGACWMLIEPKRHLGLWHALTEAEDPNWRLVATEGEVALLYHSKK